MMDQNPQSQHEKAPPKAGLYCPRCEREVDDPLTCGDCLAIICRVCGTPLESSDDLAVG